jgi:hypothetical protein
LSRKIFSFLEILFPEARKVRFLKIFTLFWLGGLLYGGMELTWRGRTHWSMVLLGGLSFLLLGQLRLLRIPLGGKCILGALGVTLLELGCGLLVNRSYQVWDYRHLPLNYLGQICLPFTVVRAVISLAAFFLYDYLDRWLERMIY